jgi:multiple sugar transport system ATP-binding protein
MELLGESTMVTIKSGKSLISVKAGKEYRVEIGNEVSISIPIGICHLFNLETGERIRA